MKRAKIYTYKEHLAYHNKMQKGKKAILCRKKRYKVLQRLSLEEQKARKKFKYITNEGYKKIINKTTGGCSRKMRSSKLAYKCTKYFNELTDEYIKDIKKGIEPIIHELVKEIRGFYIEKPIDNYIYTKTVITQNKRIHEMVPFMESKEDD